MLTPTRLRLARQRKGWTLKKLSEQSGISVRTLSSYENGEHEPRDLRVVETLANTLGVMPEFLNSDDVEFLNPEAVSFRKLSKTTAGRRDAALAAGRMAMEISEWIETNFRIPEPDVPTLEKHRPETAAMMLRERWGLGELPISNMLHLLEAHGVRVFSLASDCRDVDAFSVAWDGRPFIFLNTAMSGERQRFDAGHELGHLVLHGDADRVHGRDKEQEANRFAASLLMPRRAVIAQGLREANLDRIMAAKKHWKVAAMAMTHRLSELQLLSEWGYRNTCIALSKQGFRSGEPGGIKSETSQVLAKVMWALRESGNNSSSLVQAVGLDELELNRHMFDLVPRAVDGGGQTTPNRGRLNLVK